MLRFIAYSDIHHDEYNNGITEMDVVDVEDQITKYAIENKIETVFFLGDWFRATNPNRNIIASAEACWKRRSDSGIKTYVLVGNHDRWTKSATSGHAFVSASIFNNDLANVEVMDEVCTLEFGDTCFLFIPSGHENSESVVNFSRPSGSTVVVLFHGLVAGSALANGGSAGNGIHPDILRNIRADVIIGGDNHTHQRLDDLLGCPSVYVGATMQHNWGDRNQQRGFLDFVVASEGRASFTFISSKSPKFIRVKIPAVNEMDAICKINDIITNKLDGEKSGILEITLLGKNVSKINIDTVEAAVRNIGVRRIRVILDRTFEKVELVPGMQYTNLPEDKWSLFVAGTDTKELNQVLLEQMGKWAIQEAKRQY